jgi:ABC-2 type transport system permease protein
MMRPIWSLFSREIIGFYRQRSRVVGAMLQPLLFWVLLGAGMNASFKQVGSDENFTSYFFPGMLLMVVMFTAIFATITIIDDRREKFLQGVLVAPVSPSTLVAGKMLGGAALAVIQGFLIALIAWTPLLPGTPNLLGFGLLIAWMFVVGCMLTCGGVMMAWPMSSSHGYHALMSVLLFPLWMFSGAAFPIEGTPAWLHALMTVNPLTHALKVLRALFHYGDGPIPMVSLLITVGATILLFSIAVLMVRRRGKA